MSRGNPLYGAALDLERACNAIDAEKARHEARMESIWAEYREALKRVREAAGLPFTRLGRMSGISGCYFCSIGTGKAIPTPQAGRKLAAAMKDLARNQTRRTDEIQK